ncbi:MAG TPA: CPBP family glutamic-type intramembrane protease [Candidatus Saccharimonadia bacterium]
MLAVWLRIVIGGPGVAQSASAGLIFAACLFALGLAAHTKLVASKQSIAIGIAGGIVLSLPALFAHVSGHLFASTHGYLSWSIIVTVVAIAEEYFLRGTLYDAITSWHGESVAIFVAAIAFALLHVPLYGWHVLPLDLAVGLWLGSLRAISKTWAAAAIAHTLADLLAWWLR